MPWVELIFSSPNGTELLADGSYAPAITERETQMLSLTLLDALRAKYAIIGIHVRFNGRVDVHLLIVNTNIDGLSLQTGLVHPTTRKPLRNLLVVARANLDTLHDALNVQREASGKPRIRTNLEVQRARDEERRLSKAMARYRAEWRDAEGKGMELIVGPHSEKKDPAEAQRKEEEEEKKKRESAEAKRSRFRWEQLTRFVYILAEHRRLSKEEERKKARWFDNTGRLRSDIARELEKAAIQDRVPEAIEAKRTMESYLELEANRPIERRADIEKRGIEE